MFTRIKNALNYIKELPSVIQNLQNSLNVIENQVNDVFYSVDSVHSRLQQIHSMAEFLSTRAGEKALHMKTAESNVPAAKKAELDVRDTPSNFSESRIEEIKEKLEKYGFLNKNGDKND